MEIILLVFIVVVQNIAVFFDNYAIFYLTSRYNSKKIATVYSNKFKIDFLSRCFLFFTPPLLGLILTQDNLYLLLLSLLISSFFTFHLTLIQVIWFLKEIKMRFLFPKNLKNFILLIVGLVVYGTYLYVPFYLNIIGYYFKENSLWIVQLSPALTVFSTIFVVYYMDPKIAKFIDSSKTNRKYEVIFELITIRMLGRFIILLSSLFLFFTFI
ncbi:hypothetical protein N9J93_00355 [Methylophilaceae bacterium]|nr:hypothetical protein [Methylophilaceae bacterium]